MTFESSDYSTLKMKINLKLFFESEAFFHKAYYHSEVALESYILGLRSAKTAQRMIKALD